MRPVSSQTACALKPHQDPGRDEAKQLADAFERYGIPIRFQIYPGTHTSAVAERFQNHVLPFFAENLCPTLRCAHQ